MKIKISEATPIQLDWLVAKYERYQNITGIHPQGRIRIISGQFFNPSTDWAQGGPIIEREKHIAPLWEPSIQSWYACNSKGTGAHPTSPLIAAMRCYVASKLGDEVEIPDELT